MNPYIQYMYSYPHKTAYRPLDGISLRTYAPRLSGPGHGLYLHIPFCQAKCGYCNLFSVTGQADEGIDHYLDAVERQAGQYHDMLAFYGTVFSSFTIGGGTPLILTERQLERIFSMVGQAFDFSEDREVVIETAPNQTTEKKLELLKALGVTRVSMGVQSFCDEELKALNRCHSARKAQKALGLLQSYGFSCMNVDLIYGIPGQSVDSLLYSLQETLAFEPEEIFLYPLYIKHGAGLEKRLGAGMELDTDKMLSQYRAGSDFLKTSGYRQDSMRRFVRRRKWKKGGGQAPSESRGFSDCGFGTSLALGCGGRSYLGELHFCTPYAITREGCLEQILAFERETDFSRITHGFLLSEEEQKRRYVIRHFLIAPGLDLGRYERQFGSRAMDDFPLLRNWVSQGWADYGGGYLGLTEAGLGLSDYLGPQLISREVLRRMEEWEVMHGWKDAPVSGKPEKL